MTQALILAGGLGTRLRSVVSDRPKPMASIGDRPFLEYQIAGLRKSGVDEVILAVGYMADAIEAHFGTGKAFGVTIRYAIENDPLGTAGAIRNARALLGAQPFFALNGDTILTDLDYGELLKCHEGAVATLVAARPPDAGAYGVLEFDSSRKRIVAFREKAPIDPEHASISAGVYVLDPSVLDFIPEGQRTSIEVDTFPALLASGKVLNAYFYRGFFGDMGTPAGLERVSQRVLEPSI